MHVCVYIYIYIYIYIHKHTYSKIDFGTKIPKRIYIHLYSYTYVLIYIYTYTYIHLHIYKHQHLGCNSHCQRKWMWGLEFKSWMRLIAFYKVLIPWWKVWIRLSCLQIYVNIRSDWALWPWYGNHSRRRKTLNSNLLNF